MVILIADCSLSPLCQIMQRIAQQAGITENYTNYSIRSSYIPLIEELCQETLNSDLAPRIPPPPNPMTRAMDDSSGGDEGSLGDNSSVSSDSKDTEVDDSTVGKFYLNPAPCSRCQNTKLGSHE